MNEMQMLDPFIIRALIAGVGIASISGVLGCFVIWKRLAYFADSIAHSTILGVALGFVAEIATEIGVIIVCFAFIIFLLWLQKNKALATDTLLCILTYTSLSIGMVIISVIGQRFDIHSYLFGDILTVTLNEIYLIYIGGFITLIILMLNWSSFILMTIHEDLAAAEGVPVLLINSIFMFLIMIVVIVSIRIVGVILITSMLIIPAASARYLTHSPKNMAIVASLLCVASIIIGILCSNMLDIFCGPSIVISSAAIFMLTLLFSTFVLKK